MIKNNRVDFCTACRKNTEYTLTKRSIIKNIRGKDYKFNITAAVCNKCGEEMNIPGLIDENVQEIDEQYRKYENIVSISDIKKLMEIYNIGKGPLSLALGFGEITIPRYLSGQIPSKEYSDIIRSALYSPAFMKEKLMENKDKITPLTYKKSLKSIIRLEKCFSVSDKMLTVISCLFKKIEEVTPLMLQKLLYFIQGTSYAVNKKPMFLENCQAWVHGPVYPEVYNMFKDFKYNPIEDARFVILEGKDNTLTEDEEKVINLVTNTFGQYGGKVLEKITHNEKPWIDARKGYSDDVPSHEVISLKSIKSYYNEINLKYDFSSENGLSEYIKTIV